MVAQVGESQGGGERSKRRGRDVAPTHIQAKFVSALKHKQPHPSPPLLSQGRERSTASIENHATVDYELHESIEHPARCFAHSGRFCAKCSRPGCSSYGRRSTSSKVWMPS
jgi:hypothetical protein